MIVETAPAKLNLALHVRARRADGYHDLETLFAFAAEGDEVRIAPADVPSFTITGPFAPGLEWEGDNLVTRAVDRFAATVAPLPPLAIELDKRLPVASGIGGGSADAAAALRACARLTATSLDDPRLMAVAQALGADVPACLRGISAIGSGRGDALTPLDGLAGTPVLLVNPGVAVATVAVFSGWDGVDRGALPSGDAWTIARDGRNDLAAPATRVAPVIGEVIAMLDGLDGARVVRMSGSGATCFALFDDAAARDSGNRTIAAARPGWWRLATVLA